MKQKSALITGIGGQDGPYLALELLGQGYQVYGIDQKLGQNAGLKEMDIERKIDLVEGDMTDSVFLQNLIKKTAPDEIYHLAAISNVSFAWENPLLTTQVNCEGIVNLLEAVRFYAPKARVLHACSGELFGSNPIHTLAEGEIPRFAPQNPYAVSKLFGFYLGKSYAAARGVYFVNALFHNHESPLRPTSFVTRKISESVAKISLGLSDALVLGNISAKRDWGFAGDYMEAAFLTLQQPNPDDYLIATGKSHSIEDFVRVAFAHVGISDYQKYLQSDEALMRPNDTNVVEVDISSTEKKLGWKPKLDFEGLVRMMVDADLKRQKWQLRK